MTADRHTEAAFETVIEAHLLAHGYMPVDRADFDRGRAIFPETVLAFIHETQPAEWAKLEALHGDKTGEQIREAFKMYYEGAEMGEEVDPARMYAIKGELDASGIYLDEEVERFCAV